MKNDYKVFDNYIIIYLKRRKGKALEAKIDADDFGKLNKFGTWRAMGNPHTKSYYCIAGVKKNGKWAPTLMHRVIMNPLKVMCVDHIDHDTLDNRKSKLRIVTNSQNSQNRKSAQRNSKTGIRGVSWNKQKRKWEAKITLNRKGKHIGLYENIKDAEGAVGKARKKYMPFSKEGLINHE